MPDSPLTRFKHLREKSPQQPPQQPNNDELAPDQHPLDLEPLTPEPKAHDSNGKGLSRRSFLSGLGAASLVAGAAPLVAAAPAIAPVADSRTHPREAQLSCA